MKKVKTSHVIMCIFMILVSFISVYPLIWVVFQSLKTETQFLSSIWTLPTSFHFDNYREVWEKQGLSVYFMNSVYATIITTIIDIVLVSMAGFVFSKLEFKFKKFWYNFIILNLLIPTPIILMPMFLMINSLNIKNTIWALVFPYLQGFAPLGLIIAKNYYDSLPNDLIDAAKIDGCSIFGTFIKIMAPLTKPIIATMAILGSMQAWNEYIWALVSITEQKKYTLSVGIAVLNDKSATMGYTPVFAALSISSMVIVIIYLFMQKQFVASIASGAVKG